MIKFMMSIFIFFIDFCIKLAEIYNLEIFDASSQPTHGGSMRYYLCKKIHTQKQKD